MVKLGKFNTLEILRSTAQGLYLEGGAYEEILLPKGQVTPDMREGREVEVFVYRDSEDRVIATTAKPLVQVGEYASLEVVSVNSRVGAFLDWGLPKDLLLPFKEQAEMVSEGETVVVSVLVDSRSDRIIATSKLDRTLRGAKPDLRPGDGVRFLISERTPVGYKGVVEGGYPGFILHCDAGKSLRSGESLPALVKSVGPGSKVMVCLDQDVCGKTLPLARVIVQALEANGGTLPYGDKSSPDQIKLVFDVSKKTFKQAVGTLYRQRKVTAGATEIRLADS